MTYSTETEVISVLY